MCLKTATNNNNNNNPICKAPKALASEALAVGQSAVVLNTFQYVTYVTLNKTPFYQFA